MPKIVGTHKLSFHPDGSKLLDALTDLHTISLNTVKDLELNYLHQENSNNQDLNNKLPLTFKGRSSENSLRKIHKSSIAILKN